MVEIVLNTLRGREYSLFVGLAVVAWKTCAANSDERLTHAMIQ